MNKRSVLTVWLQSTDSSCSCVYIVFMYHRVGPPKIRQKMLKLPCRSGTMWRCWKPIDSTRQTLILSITPSRCPRDSAEEDWEVCQTIFWGEVPKMWSISSKIYLQKHSWFVKYPTERIVLPYQGVKLLYYIAFWNYAFHWRNISIGYFPANALA